MKKTILLALMGTSLVVGTAFTLNSFSSASKKGDCPPECCLSQSSSCTLDDCDEPFCCDEE